MTDKFTRSLVVLEREAYDAQKKVEQLRATRESFAQTSRVARNDRSEDVEPGRSEQGIKPRASAPWMMRGQSSVSNAAACKLPVQRMPARSLFRKHLPACQGCLVQIRSVTGCGSASAFTLPLIIFGFIALLIFFWMAAKGH